MSRYWSSVVKRLKPYVPGEQPVDNRGIKLNTNENPYNPSPKVLNHLPSEIHQSLRLYPDPNTTELKKSIAEYHQVTQEEVFIGNGSDEVLAHVFQGLLKHSKSLLFPDITYSFYKSYCSLYDINFVQISTTESFEISIKDYMRPNGGVIFPNPNAPTGIFLPLASIVELLRNNSDSVVVIDEAYIDFGGASAVELTKEFPNLLVIRTFSKSRSLAGLRVGYAVGNALLIEALERVKNCFNSYPLGQLAISGAVSAIQDEEYFNRTTNTIIKTRDMLSIDLSNIGFKVLPSKANFLFISHADCDAKDILASLRKSEVMVRHFDQERINQFLRVTVGTVEDCSFLVEKLKDIVRRK